MKKWFAGCDNVKLFELHKKWLMFGFASLWGRIQSYHFLDKTLHIMLLLHETGASN